MLKNIVTFRLTNGWPTTFDVLKEQVEKKGFVPCGPIDRRTDGFVTVRENADMALAVQNQWVLRLKSESKVLPGKAVKKALQEKVNKIQQEQDRKVGKKEKDELKALVIDELLPKCLTVDGDCLIWVDPTNGFVSIGLGNRTKGEEVLNIFRKALDPLPELSLVPFERQPSEAMREWLSSGEAPAGFTIDDKCELVQPADKSTVRYVHHSLEGQDVVNHLSSGKIPKSLAMTWNDRVSFVMTADFEIKSIKLLDAAKADFTPGESKDERFDADFLLDASEISGMLNDLIAAIGEKK